MQMETCKENLACFIYLSCNIHEVFFLLILFHLHQAISVQALRFKQRKHCLMWFES